MKKLLLTIAAAAWLLAAAGAEEKEVWPAPSKPLNAVEREWQTMCDRKFGIGNISMDGGKKYEHQTHMKGIEMDAARCARTK